MGSDAQAKRMCRIRIAMPADPLRQLPHGPINRQHRPMVCSFVVRRVWPLRIHGSSHLIKMVYAQAFSLQQKLRLVLHISLYKTEENVR